MRFLSTFVGILGLAVLASCGGGNSISVDIDLAVNGGGNPITDLNDQYETKQSQGIFFYVDKARNCPPAGPFDYDLSAEPINPQGLKPASDSFDLDTASLQPNTYYQIRMVAIPTGSSLSSHEGKSDCPFAPGLGNRNLVTICFGDVALTGPDGGPLCADTLPFTACPSILASAEVCN